MTTTAAETTEKPARALVLSIIAAITLTAVSRSSLFPPIDRSVTDGLIVLLPVAGFVLSLPRLASRRDAQVGLWIAISFAVVVTISGLVNGPGIASVFGMLLPAVIAVVLVLLGSIITVREFRTIARWVILLAVVQAVFAIADVNLLQAWAQQAALTNGVYIYRPNLIVDGIGRASGTMGHPILLGLICTIGAVLALGKDIIRRPVVRLLLVALLLWAVVLSGSRSSVAAFAVAVLLFFIHPASPAKRGIRILMVIIVTPLTLVYVNEAITTARQVSLFSLTNRIDALPRLMDTLRRPAPEWLIGEGSRFNIGIADNQFLTTSGSYGLLGLLILLAAIIYALSSRSPIVVATLGCLAFMSLSFDTLTWGFSSFLFWFLIGVSRSEVARAVEIVRPVRAKREDGRILQATMNSPRARSLRAGPGASVLD